MEKEILERSFKDTKAEERAMAEEHNGQKTVNSNLVEIKIETMPCLKQICNLNRERQFSKFL